MSTSETSPTRCRLALALLPASAALLVAALALLGWVADRPSWLRPLPELAPMQPNTALGILAVALSLGMRVAGLRILAASLATFSLSVGALTLLQYAAGVSTGLDQSLIEVGVAGDLFPGRMSPNTAASVSLLGAAGALSLLRSGKISRSLTLGLVLMAGGIALVSALEHLMGAKPSEGWGATTRMAPNTTLCLLLLVASAAGLHLLTQVRESLLDPFAYALWLALAMLSAGVWSRMDAEANQVFVDEIERVARRIDERIASRIAGQLANLGLLASDPAGWRRASANRGWRQRAGLLAARDGYLCLALARGADRLHVCPAGDASPDAGAVLRHVARAPWADPAPHESHVRAIPGELLAWSHHAPPSGEEPTALIALAPRGPWLQSLREGLPAGFDLRILQRGERVLETHATDPGAPHVARATIPGWSEGTLEVWPSRATSLQMYTRLPTMALLSGLIASLLCGLARGLWWRSRQLLLRIDGDLERLHTILDNLSDGVVVASSTGELVLFNHRAEEMLGLGPTQVDSTEWARVYQLYELDGQTPYPHERLPLVMAMSGTPCDHVELAFRSPTHEELRYMSASGRPLTDERGQVTGGVVVFRDVTEPRTAAQERSQLEVQLAQAQKLEAIGQLAAGIAHEMNTPAQFVGDNLRFLNESFQDLFGLCELWRSLQQRLSREEPVAELHAKIERSCEEADLDFLLEEIPCAIQQSIEGTERVVKIVTAMKNFSHPGASGRQLVDTRRTIESTITVARNEWKYVADVVTDFDEALPEIFVEPGEFNQVILNLIVNAAHAIAGARVEGERGRIVVRTRREAESAVIEVSDTGPGIPDEIRRKIFEPFFTTKPVGKGTGQGLAIVHSIIVGKHGGQIDVRSDPGQGACFTLRIPLEGSDPDEGG